MRPFDKTEDRRPIPEGELLPGEVADATPEAYSVTDEVCLEAVDVQSHFERGELPDWLSLPRAILA